MNWSSQSSKRRNNPADYESVHGLARNVIKKSFNNLLAETDTQFQKTYPDESYGTCPI